MKSRLRAAVLLALLAGFVLGVWVGGYIGQSPSPAESKLSGGHSTNAPGAILQASGTRAPGESQGHPIAPIIPANAESPVTPFWSALTLGDEDQRHTEWLQLLPSLNNASALAIRGFFEKMDAQGRHLDFEWSTFWPRWGEVDPLGALANASLEPNERRRDQAIALTIRGWARQDPAAARAWLTANTTSPNYESAARGYLDGLARTDLERATREATPLAAGHNIRPFMDVLAEQALQQRHYSGMKDWWDSLPDDLRRQASEPVYRRLQSADIGQSEVWFTEWANSPYRDDERIGSFASRLAEKDPAHAVEWVSNLPPSQRDGHYTGITRTMRAWAESDIPAMEKWMNHLPPSPLRDQVFNAYGQFVQAAQPAPVQRK